MRPSKKKNRSERNKQGNEIGEDGRVSNNGVRRNFGEVRGEENEGVGACVDLNIEIINIDPKHPTNKAHTEVVDVEEQLKRREDVPSCWVMLDGCLHECSRNLLRDWGSNLSGVDAVDLVGSIVPTIARTYNNLPPTKGLDLVEVIDKNKGFTRQFYASRANILKFYNTQSQLFTSRNKFQENICKEICRESQKRFDRTQKIYTAEHTKMQLEIKELTRRTSDLKAHLGSLSAIAKKSVEFSDKVKKLVMLTLARKAMETALGTMKGTTETWFAYFHRITDDDWHRIGVESGFVRYLLEDITHAFNDSIYEIPAKEVVGSIVSMPLGFVRSAWEEIFYLAFQRRVTDEVFREELDYAIEQSRILKF